jgi:putative ABC transport system substrate-binding protein
MLVPGLGTNMRRRDFLIVPVGVVVACSSPLRAQQAERMRRVGVLMNYFEDDPDAQARLASFLRGMQQLGWIDGRNAQIVIRWTAAAPDRIQASVAELIAIAPDAIFAPGSPAVALLKKVTNKIPIVFAGVVDPVGAGFVASMARPGGNVTGFTQFEYEMSGKWLELLKEMSSNVTRAAIIRDTTISAGAGQVRAIEAVAPSMGIELRPVAVRDTGEIERDLTEFARMPNGSLIVTGSARTLVHRNLIIALAARHRLPAVYFQSSFIEHGGLMSYGIDLVEHFGHAAAYVDRILKDEKPADLPVQAPTKYELAINQQTAKTLGLTVPPSRMAHSDQSRRCNILVATGCIADIGRHRGWMARSRMTPSGHRPAFHVAVAKPISGPIKALS